jgi:anti-sigma B factor antagonist
MEDFSIARSGDDVVVSMNGELDEARLADVASIGTEALAQARDRSRRIVVDLARVAFMDSLALGALIAMRNEADRARIRFAVRALQPQVQRLLEMTELTDYLAVEAPAVQAPAVDVHFTGQ